MTEIDAVYAVKDGSNTLENEWTVDRIYVLRDTVPLEGGNCGSIREIMSVMGQPLYFGTVWVELPEAVAWNLLAGERPNQLERVDVTAEPTFENVFSVSDYDRDYQLYLYTFEYDGLLYHFYFTQSGESQFLMYAMEKA